MLNMFNFTFEFCFNMVCYAILSILIIVQMFVIKTEEEYGTNNITIKEFFMHFIKIFGSGALIFYITCL